MGAKKIIESFLFVWLTRKNENVILIHSAMLYNKMKI